LLIEPDFADAWAEKGAALALYAFQQSFYDEDFPAALATYELSWAAAQRATELEPGHPLGLAVQGLVRLNQKRWIEARVYFERAISVNNPNDYAFLWLGILQTLTGDTEGAIAMFESRLEESPSAPNLVRWHVQTLEGLGRSGIIWDSKAASGKTAQLETVFTKQTAGLQLGKISIDDFVAWFETISTDMSAEERASAITLIRTLHDDPEAAIDTAVWNRLKQQGALKLVRSYAIAIGKNYARYAAVERLNLIAAQPNDNSLTLFWSEAASSVRQSPEFHEMVRELDLPTYWDLYGWPPACLRTGTNDFECQ
jgi:tetratricopeptide (TPR) repeat protein